MAKTGYTTHWVPLAGANMKVLKTQHQRVFKGNQLAVVEDEVRGKLIKVAVMNGETAPVESNTEWPSVKRSDIMDKI